MEGDIPKKKTYQKKKWLSAISCYLSLHRQAKGCLESSGTSEISSRPHSKCHILKPKALTYTMRTVNPHCIELCPLGTPHWNENHWTETLALSTKTWKNYSQQDNGNTMPDVRGVTNISTLPQVRRHLQKQEFLGVKPVSFGVLAWSEWWLCHLLSVWPFLSSLLKYLHALVYNGNENTSF